MSTAWAAGFFEGEGSIYLIPNLKSVALSITGTDYDVLERLQSVFGGKIYDKTYEAKPTHYKQQWAWKLQTKQGVVSVLEKMLPFFGERRACKALDAFDHYDGI